MRYPTALACLLGLAGLAIPSQAGAERIEDYRLTTRMYPNAYYDDPTGWGVYVHHAKSRT